MKENSVLPKAKDNVKKYINNKKVEKYSLGKKNAFWVSVIDILIALVSIATFYFVYFVNTDVPLKYIGYGVIVLFSAFVIVKILTIVLKSENSVDNITKLVLLGEDGHNIKTWNVKGKVSLLIGKSTKDSEVDIDLSSAEYSELISRQHAVLNYAEDTWYLEDIGSSNGSGLMRVSEGNRFKLDTGRLYKISSGDIIYIANTKIMVE